MKPRWRLYYHVAAACLAGVVLGYTVFVSTGNTKVGTVSGFAAILQYWLGYLRGRV